MALEVLVHPAMEHEPSSTLCARWKLGEVESVQPGNTASHLPGVEALGSKLGAAESMQPLYLQPRSREADSRWLTAAESIQPQKT